ncbi:MAG: Nif11 domain/cupin domain-containing protein [Cyanobacteriota bacterium]|nr:Nif11 domain/cupin domain-containing protein [Cyanobacteriota bacterium]
MAEAQLQQFLHKVAALNAFVALSQANPAVGEALRQCSTHHEVVSLARCHGFEIGRRWGEEEPAAAGGGGNLLGGPCPGPGQETIAVLLEQPGLRLERIHSCSASSPAQGWYEQPEHEWVAVLQGSARLQFDDEPVARDLSRGDALLITPHRRHRVVATDPAPGTVWLALFWWAPAAG